MCCRTPTSGNKYGNRWRVLKNCYEHVFSPYWSGWHYKSHTEIKCAFKQMKYHKCSEVIFQTPATKQLSTKLRKLKSYWSWNSWDFQFSFKLIDSCGCPAVIMCSLQATSVQVLSNVMPCFMWIIDVYDVGVAATWETALRADGTRSPWEE